MKQHLAEGKSIQAHKQPLLSQAEALGFNTMSEKKLKLVKSGRKSKKNSAQLQFNSI